MKDLNRSEDKLKQLSSFEKIHKYRLLETFFIVLLFLTAGYFLSPDDVCLVKNKIPYLLVLLSVITLFHGFESGMLAIALIASAMWFFYPLFPYVEFLILLMMTLLFSQFQYYWFNRIREAELTSEYKSIKLHELSKAFYALKISHDQLEKNYVSKTMSLRDSLISIRELSESKKERYRAFLTLLEKSFNIESAAISLLDEDGKKFHRVIASESMEGDDDYNDPLVQDVFSFNRPAYISNGSVEESKYIAVIPIVKSENVVGMLMIEKMPFMAFNRENLISIAILFEYFYNEFVKEGLLEDYKEYLTVIDDREFKFEMFRLFELYKLYNVDSTILVLRFENEIFSIKVYETIKDILRNLDMVTYTEKEGVFYVSILFPMANDSIAYGFLERLKNNVELLKEKKHYETFDFSLSRMDLFDELVSGKNELY